MKDKGGITLGIVIPSFNQGIYLERAINSVISCYEYINIKIAIVDGNSTDNSKDIIDKYKDFFYFSQRKNDGGQANAINIGIEHLPDCDYYMWLNSDDVYENGKNVSRLAQYMKKNGYEVAYGLSNYIDISDRVIGRYPVQPFSRKKLESVCYISQPSVMFSRKAYYTVGPLNEKLKMCLDYEYWIRLSKKYKFGFYQEIIGNTRLYAETKTSLYQKRNYAEGIYIQSNLCDKVDREWLLGYHLCDIAESSWENKIPKQVLKLMIHRDQRRLVEKALKEVEDRTEDLDA